MEYLSKDFWNILDFTLNWAWLFLCPNVFPFRHFLNTKLISSKTSYSLWQFPAIEEMLQS